VEHHSTILRMPSTPPKSLSRDGAIASSSPSAASFHQSTAFRIFTARFSASAVFGLALDGFARDLPEKDARSSFSLSFSSCLALSMLMRSGISSVLNSVWLEKMDMPSSTVDVSSASHQLSEDLGAGFSAPAGLLFLSLPLPLPLPFASPASAAASSAGCGLVSHAIAFAISMARCVASSALDLAFTVEDP